MRENNSILTIQAKGGGGTVRPHLLFFCPLLKIALGNPYLKILELTKNFVADAPMKTKFKKFSFTPSQSTLKYGSKNRPWPKGLIYMSCLRWFNLDRCIDLHFLGLHGLLG